MVGNHRRCVLVARAERRRTRAPSGVTAWLEAIVRSFRVDHHQRPKPALEDEDTSSVSTLDWCLSDHLAGGPPSGRISCAESHLSGERATLVDAPHFDSEADCNALHMAMHGFGCKADAVIDILAARSSRQREQIKTSYKRLFGKDLQHAMDSELKGELERIVKALLMSSAEFDAHEMKHAMKGSGSDEHILLEILCTRTDSQRREMAADYERIYHKTLERAIKSETGGDFEHLLVALLNASRPEHATVNRQHAKEDAQKLFKAGEKKFGTDESAFNAVLCSRSNAHLRAVFEEYQALAGHDLETAIKKEVGGKFRDGLLAIEHCVKNGPGYFATCLNHAMKGLGTNEETVHRIVVSRCEIDMKLIKEQYHVLYKKRLEEAIAHEMGGRGEKALIKLIQG